MVQIAAGSNEKTEGENTDFSPHHFWLRRLKENILAHLEKEELSNAFLAQKMNVSESHFYRLVKERIGKSPNLYVREVRLNYAKMQIESGQFKQVNEIAYQVGFKRVDYFSKLFLRQFGVRPKELIKTTRAHK